MKIVDLPIDQLHEAAWNVNKMDTSMRDRLENSLKRFGLVENLVVRKLKDAYFEVLSGNQRLGVLRDTGVKMVACVVVDANDAESRLLAQVMNRIHGEDDLGLRAEVIREVLKSVSVKDITAVLPESTMGLESLRTLGDQPIAEHLQKWQQAKQARLRHLQFQLTQEQVAVVEEALGRMMSRARNLKGESPNTRGIALYLLCREYLEGEDDE
jgi:ParB family chromosome partitioning protein